LKQIDRDETDQTADADENDEIANAQGGQLLLAHGCSGKVIMIAAQTLLRLNWQTPD
jgi:hypothetical protein